MSAIKRTIGRKAAKSAAKHSAHGVVSKLSRTPVRSVTLLALGILLGGVAGWLIGRQGEAGAIQPS